MIHCENSRRNRVLWLSLFAFGLSAAGAEGSDGTDCESADGMNFVCGPLNAEDLLHLSGSDWVIASGMSGEDHSGNLYVVDPDRRSFEKIFPGNAPRLAHDRNAFPECPGNLNVDDFSAHGIDLHPLRGSIHRLYVTSHGEREAVEVFELDASGGKPQVTWVGCVPIPEHNDINSVAALADGGFLTTRISGTGPGPSGDIFAGGLSGFLYEWHPGAKIERVARTEMSGPNGIVVSADGTRVYVASWGRSEIARFVRARDGGLRHDRTMPLNFRPDNLRWSNEGTILTAGHRLSSSQDCGQPLCFDEWEVAEIEPESMTSNTLLIRKPSPGFTGATVAIREADGLWLGTFHGDRLVHVPAP